MPNEWQVYHKQWVASERLLTIRRIGLRVIKAKPNEKVDSPSSRKILQV